MKTNKEILSNYEPWELNQVQEVFRREDCESAMKEAQSEILFQFVNNVETYPNYQAPYPYRFQLASEKTKKELEEGKEYTWFEFMGRRHKETKS